METKEKESRHKECNAEQIECSRECCNDSIIFDKSRLSRNKDDIDTEKGPLTVLEPGIFTNLCLGVLARNIHIQKVWHAYFLMDSNLFLKRYPVATCEFLDAMASLTAGINSANYKNSEDRRKK